ncbi:MAG: 30S ribosomal protein S12 methylthiotransferase RimO [Bacteroidales bacterium]|nr:30S ribosomal protein S12 methylthiotransferase RimO [Bacteroidales bacterium]MCF8339194.1 30S ribosomal protein S12 methylthiotransferase RimO [Bacteroidales bacterium]
MKAKQNYHIGLVTLGCAKNQVDSEFLAGRFRASGLETSHKLNASYTDAVIINTCGFILDAKEESINTILQYIEMKKEGSIGQVFAMGCLTQRYRGELQKEIPELDGIFGVNEHEKIVETVAGKYREELVGERLLTTPSHYAYLKISEGCDRTCSFCAIPLIRGKNVSKPIEELVQETENLAAKGVKELILIAQDLTYYGLDRYKKRMLAPLLKELVRVNGIEWIRLHYTFPAQFPLEVLAVMQQEPKICNYLDIPLQHINTQLLQSMHRGIDKEGTLALINTIRKEVPRAALRTTLIAGYPGETEQQFQELKNFVKATRFERMGAFPYSHEEDTPAYKLQDDVPQEIKEERVSELMELQQDISLELNRQKTGKTMKVIIDREDEEYYIGRTEYDSPEVDNEVLVSKDVALETGAFANVHITNADAFDLYAKVDMESR